MNLLCRRRLGTGGRSRSAGISTTPTAAGTPLARAASALSAFTGAATAFAGTPSACALSAVTGATLARSAPFSSFSAGTTAASPW